MAIILKTAFSTSFSCMKIVIFVESPEIHSKWPLLPRKLPRSLINTLEWPHNERHGVSNHHPEDCLLKRLFRRRSKKTSMLRVTGLCVGNSPVTGEFPTHKGPVTQKLFPFDDAIMNNPGLIQIMGGRRTSDKPLSESVGGIVYSRKHASHGLNAYLTYANSGAKC